MDKTANRHVIMVSIHPQFAEAIFRGEKKVEFRKLNIPKEVKHIVLYTTAPKKKITGYFRVKEVVEATAEELWRMFSNVSGISEEAFFKYYGKEGKGRGFLVDDVNVFYNPISLEELNGETSRPPQSFVYIDHQRWKNLRRHKKILDSGQDNGYFAQAI